jgi:hypothetical protein
MGTYRVIVINDDRSRSTYVVNLDAAPYVGDTLKLPHGETVLVHHTGPSPRDGLGGVIIAGPQ